MLILSFIKKNKIVVASAVVLMSLVTVMLMTPVDIFAASVSVPSASGKVTANGGTYVRSSYSTKSKVKTTLAKGKAIAITSEKITSKTSTAAKYKWYKLATYSGYVRSDLASISYGSITGKTTTTVYMRKGPSTKFGKASAVSGGKTVTVVLRSYNKYGNKWYKIKSGSKYYYIYSKYVKLTGSSSSGTSSNSGGSSSGNTVTSSYAKSLVAAGFPASYATKLEALHKAHPTWTFKPVQTGLDWSSAASKMTANTNTNLTYITYAPSYRSTDKGCYNYLTNSYVGKDSSSFVAASKNAVYYYMDPRNWLTSSYIFMFEDNKYHSYQTESLVKNIVQYNSALKSNAGYFVTAGKTYDVSPVYLASKAYSEIGTSTYTVSGKKITYKTKKYKSYNAFNIGAYDSASGGAAYNGLVYAISGTTYSRPWTSLYKAIAGGAQFIRKDFIANNQSSGYLEHFNVLNGSSSVGSHVYMTAVYAPMSMAYSVSEEYSDAGITGKAIEFYIPVYKNMPSSACAKPSTSKSVDNNYYLSKLYVAGGSSPSKFIKSSKLCYTTDFSKTVSHSVKTVTITATKASKSATVSGAGTKSLAVGKNTFYVKCRSSSGLTRTYTITVTRSK